MSEDECRAKAWHCKETAERQVPWLSHVNLAAFTSHLGSKHGGSRNTERASWKSVVWLHADIAGQPVSIKPSQSGQRHCRSGPTVSRASRTDHHSLSMLLVTLCLATGHSHQIESRVHQVQGPSHNTCFQLVTIVLGGSDGVLSNLATSN